jgi:xylulokinase
MDSGALVIGLSALLAALGDDRRRVVGVGVAGIAESGVPLDRSRRALAPVIAWLDPRGGDEVAQVEQHFGPDLALRTGERLRPVATAAKLGWLVAHGVSGLERWLGVPELVVHALTGAEATEHSLAARTGCYDVTKQVWIPEVAALLDFDVDVFPPVHAAGTVMGRVTEDGAAWSGLAPGVAVTVAGHDHLAGMVGAGVGRHDLANSVGTAETIVGRVRDRPDLSAALEQRVAVRLVPGGREFAVLVSAARAGVVLEAAAAALGRSLADLDGLAEGGAPGDVGDAVDRLAGGTTPAFPDAPPGRIWAGLLEALTARTVDGYERLVRVTGAPPDRMVVFGGGSVSRPWLQAKARALPVPVVPSTVSAAVARGAALYGGVAAGWWPSVDEAPAPTPPPRPPSEPPAPAG